MPREPDSRHTSKLETSSSWKPKSQMQGVRLKKKTLRVEIYRQVNA